MADISCDGLDGLMLSIQEIAEIPIDVQDAMLNAQADIIVEAQKAKGLAYGVHRTGVTINSIKKGKPRQTKEGRAISISPTGKNQDGNSNAEVAFVNNYGKRSQKARPFITDANEQSADATTQAALPIYDAWLSSKNL